MTAPFRLADPPPITEAICASSSRQVDVRPTNETPVDDEGKRDRNDIRITPVTSRSFSMIQLITIDKAFKRDFPGAHDGPDEVS